VLDPVDPAMLNVRQQMAYEMLRTFVENKASQVEAAQILMQINGRAGSGKSFWLKCLDQFIKSQRVPHNFMKIAAPTGTAAFNVGGTTLHALLKLPINYPKNAEIKGLTGDILKKIQHEFEGTELLVIDEKSMVSLSMLHHIHLRLCQAKPEHAGENFGGVSIILMGDFAQLPPVGDRALFAFDNLKGFQAHGRYLYTSFDKVITFNEVMRQRGPEQELYRQILSKVCDGNFKLQDWNVLFSQDLSKMEPSKKDVFEQGAIKLCTRNKDLKSFNIKQMVALETPLTPIKADNKPSTAGNASTNKAGGLPNRTLLAQNCRVMLTANRWKEAGLTNGAQGTVIHIIYRPGSKPPSLPAVVLVQVDQYIGPSYMDNVPNVVPIFPQSSFWFEGQVECTRLMLPLMPAYAISVHKSQGMTLNKVDHWLKKVKWHQTINFHFCRSSSIWAKKNSLVA
jgi:ATP-dependent DNA helicase PIF1